MENMDQWESLSDNESCVSSRSSRYYSESSHQHGPQSTATTPASFSAAKFIRKRRERMLGISASSSPSSNISSQRPVRVRRTVLGNKEGPELAAGGADGSLASTSASSGIVDRTSNNTKGRKAKTEKTQSLSPMQMEIRHLYDSICRKYKRTLRESINTSWSDNWQNISTSTKQHYRFKLAQFTTPTLQDLKATSSDDIMLATEEAVKNKLSTVETTKVSVVSEKIVKQVNSGMMKQDQRVPIITIGHVSQIPPVLDWTAIPHNMHEDDGKFLTNIPFLGDEFIDKDSHFIDEMMTLYEGKVHEDTDSSNFRKMCDEVLYMLVQSMMKIEADAPDVFKEKSKVQEEVEGEVKAGDDATCNKKDKESPKKTSFSDVAAKLFTQAEPKSNSEPALEEVEMPKLVNESVNEGIADNSNIDDVSVPILSISNFVDDKGEKGGEATQLNSLLVDESRRSYFDGASSCDKISRPSDAIFSILSTTFNGLGTATEIREKYESAERSKSAPPLPILRNGMEQQTPESYSIPNIEGPFAKYLPKDATMHAYQFLFCRRCFVYDCKRHTGDDQVDSKHYKRNRQMPPVASTSSSSATATNAFNFSCKNPECWQKGFKKRNSEEILAEWTPSDRSLFLCFIDSFPSNFCFIAYLIRSKSCVQVKEYADLENVPMVESCPRGIVPRSKSKHRKKLSLNSSTKKNVTRRWINKVKKSKQPKDEGGIKSTGGILPIRYMPCLHENGEECDASCTCRINKTSCEKFCTCALTCPYRFPGCKCLSTCDSKRCICFAAARECDPDLCLGCGANETNLEKISCHNVNIQKKLHKHLLMGRSDISGWGIYIMSDVQKGEFIAEYRGELISYDESERRGHVYDKIQHTFLFELNDHFVVDATRKGNKARFVNSSKNPNCEVKRMLVNGDHRIGIYAKRFIEAGEELFYDYEDVLEKQQKAADGALRKRKE